MNKGEWWDNEARTDERYKAGHWGIRGDGSDVEAVERRIIDNVMRVRHLLAVVGVTVNVAEIGCGPGRLLNAYARRMPIDWCMGIDISPAMIAQVSAVGLSNVKPIVNDGEHLPAGPCPDLIYSVELFQHLDYEEKVTYLFEMFRWLNPGGLALIQFVLGSDIGETHAWMTHPSSREFLELKADQAGFIVHDPGFMWRLLPQWDWVLLEKPT